MSAAAEGTRVSTIIHAPRARVYQAFLDPKAVAAWMAPDTLRLHIDAFDPRAGGQFRISLQYPQPEDAGRGKTSGDTDTYRGRFVELIPNEKIVEAIEFETSDPGFAGKMTITVTLADVAGGTEVTMRYKNVPVGIRLEDNEVGTRSSLQKLAALVE